MSHLLEVKNLDVKFDTDEGRITAVENISLSLKLNSFTSSSVRPR